MGYVLISIGGIFGVMAVVLFFWPKLRQLHFQNDMLQYQLMALELLQLRPEISDADKKTAHSFFDEMVDCVEKSTGSDVMYALMHADASELLPSKSRECTDPVLNELVESAMRRAARYLVFESLTMTALIGVAYVVYGSEKVSQMLDSLAPPRRVNV